MVKKRRKTPVHRVFLDFLWENKWWWIVPMLTVFLLFFLLVAIVAQSSTTPFIYTLF